MTRVLLHATHYPHPEHVDDLLAAMAKLLAAAPGIDGLEEIGAFRDDESGRILAISVWSSAAALQAGSSTLFASLGDVPFDEWERRPGELLTLPEAVPAATA
jgi:quinol monooxygenase YgiN